MSVYKRGQVYYMDFIYKGQRVVKTTSKRVRRDALRVEEAERQRLEAGPVEVSPYADMTLAEAVERVYNDRWKSCKDGERTHSRILAMIVPLIGKVKMNDVADHHVQKVVDSLREQGREESTINRYRAYLKTIFRHAKKKWRIAPYAPSIDLVPEPKGRLRVYTSEEEKAILDYLRRVDPGMADFIVVLADTGLRVGELLSAIYSSNINFEANLIHIWDTESKSGEPKSIPMTKRVREVLVRRKELGDDRPFPYDYNRDIRPMWDKVREAMGWEEAGAEVLHGFRHTCATRLYSKTGDLYLVKHWLAHSNITVTERYAHMSPDKLQAGLTALES
jgi:integrase